MDKTRKFWLWFDFIGCISSALFYIALPAHDGIFLFSAALYGIGYLFWYLIPPHKS